MTPRSPIPKGTKTRIRHAASSCFMDETTEVLVVQIFAVHLEGGTEHVHIASVKWLNPTTAKQGMNDRASMVAWLREKGNRAYVCDGLSIVNVGVVEDNPPYIRTYADKKWTNNLLSLPNF